MPVLFYTGVCPYCGDGLVPVIEFFAERAIPLIIRKPQGTEVDRIPAYPALFVPKANVAPFLLVGTGIMDVLKPHPELAEYYGPTLHHQPKPAAGEVPSGVQRADAGDRGDASVHVDPNLRVISHGGVAIGRWAPDCCSGSGSK
jgi:hypothetical protein